MKAVAVLPERKELTLHPHPDPRVVTPDDVLIRILEVGICGTDREIASFQYGTPPAGSSYLAMGHESLGRVEEIGAAVTGLRRGDLVVPMVRRPCPHPDCTACRAGRQDFCYSGDFTERGIKQAHGFMTERVADHQRFMVPVPEALREVAVLVEPLTIAEKALTQVFETQRRLPWTCPVSAAESGAAAATGAARAGCHRALVLGAGPVGLLGSMAIAAAGFATFVYSREPETHPKAKLVAALGATYLSAAAHPVETLTGTIGNIDLIYEATGASQISFEVMKQLGTNGVFVFTGVPGRRGPVQVDTDLLMRHLVLKNQIVFGTVNAGRDAFEAAIRDLQLFLTRWPAAVRGLITSRHPLEAYRDLLLGRPQGIKNVITLS
jgi:glucose 1-dehydrogenase